MDQLRLDQQQQLFETMPDEIPFLDMTSTMLRDFEVKEIVANECSLVVSDDMKSIYRRLSRDILPFTNVLVGPSGVGKTSTLLAIGHMARKSKCLVFAFQARNLTTSYSVARWVDSFLTRWKAAVAASEIDLAKINVGPFGDESLLALVDACVICDDDVKISRFLDLVTAVKEIRSVPVVFLIDQFNILRSTFYQGSLDQAAVENGQGRIAQYFSCWNEFSLARGCVIFAATASYISMDDARDGNSMCVTQIQPMKTDLFRCLVSKLIQQSRLPDSCLVNFDVLFAHCGGIPRELICISKSFLDDPAELTCLLSINSINRFDFYTTRMIRLMDTDRAENLQKDSYEFACRLLLGENIMHVPRTWRDCGLMVRKGTLYSLACPAAERAVIQFFNPEKMRTALDMFAKDPFTSWRILELSFVYFLRLSIYDSKQVEFRCTDLCGLNPQSVVINISNIQKPESVPSPNTVQRGTLLIYARNQKIVDFMIYDATGQVVFVQISESCYANHGSKLDEIAQAALSELAKAAIGFDGISWKYLYLTTSKSLMRENRFMRNLHFDPNVLLLSNANGAADMFFRNILPSTSS
jgi:hypothetical protein